ncbi:CAP domain-containing protein [Streptomyces sp. NPDC006326]|uniref:CAP domain-containing protein n=1 Tax=Streptomyces sp. NPDC006326 TaxID=3156752 RepID=UPI0033BCBB62
MRTRIVLSVTAAAAAVAVGVAVADSDGDGHRDARADGAAGALSKSAGAGTDGPAGTATPAPASPDASATASPSPSVTAGTGPAGSPTPAEPSAAGSSTPAKPEPQTPDQPTRKPTGKGGGGSGGPGTADSSTEAAVLALVNKERASAGCGPLASDSALTAAARAYSDTMARSGVMSHTGPDGSTMTTRVEAAGYGWSRLGENIARGQADAEAVMQSWMNSPGHRANILNCAFKEIGIGVHKGDGGPWWTQDFGTPR